jgi:hypothetical protein
MIGYLLAQASFSSFYLSLSVMQKIIFMLCLAANFAAAQTTEHEFTAILPLDKMTVQHNSKSTAPDTLLNMHTVSFAAMNMLQYAETPVFDLLDKCKKLQWYSDKNCTQPLHKSIQEIGETVDTVVTYNPETYLEQIKIVRNEINSDAIVGYAARHIIEYDAATQKATATVSAIAPVRAWYNTKGGKEYQYLAWVKMPLPAQNFLADVAFAKRATLSIKNEDFIATNKAQTLANSIYTDTKKGAWQALSPTDISTNTPFTKAEFDNLGNTQLDTIVTFDPKTFAQKMQIVQTQGLKPENISRVRFKMLYFFDDKTLKLTCKIERIGIEHNALNLEGAFRYRATAFYIKPK